MKKDGNVGFEIFLHFTILTILYVFAVIKCKKMTRIITKASPFAISVLKPTGPNMHSFRALSDKVIFLDIIGPPYDEGERNCTYYTDLAEEAQSNNNTQPPLLSAGSSMSSTSTTQGEKHHTLENGAILPLDTEVETWIIRTDLVYECFSKHYPPHQT